MGCLIIIAVGIDQWIREGFKLMEPVLVAKNLSKKYGTVVALESADLELYPGEVLGVIGDNGAGNLHSSRFFVALLFQIVVKFY